jgi:flagellar biosynthesis/type III secretory pathway chaperone
MVLSENLERLKSVLQAEAEVYEELLKLAEVKQRILIDGKVPELEQVIKEEESLVAQVKQLEERRMEVHEQLADWFAVPLQDLILTRIAALAPEPHAGELAGIHRNMARTLALLGKLNQQNTQLVKQSLDYVNFSLNLIIGANDVPTYAEQRKGQKKTGASRLLDKRV